MQTVESGNPWHPAHAFTKQVVLNQRLPHRLQAIITENTVATAHNCDLLRAAVLCVSAFCEDHSTCLEVGLKLGLRETLIGLLANLDDIHTYKPLVVSIFGALAVLVGHTHSFQVEGDASVPLELISLTEADLFRSLAAAHRYLDDLNNRQEFNPVGIINCAVFLKYTLPLVASHDPLYEVCIVRLRNINFAESISAF